MAGRRRSLHGVTAGSARGVVVPWFGDHRFEVIALCVWLNLPVQARLHPLIQGVSTDLNRGIPHKWGDIPCFRGFSIVLSCDVMQRTFADYSQGPDLPMNATSRTSEQTAPRRQAF
jgi:hypothetical protein